jgi:hypothetical protein
VKIVELIAHLQRHADKCGREAEVRLVTNKNWPMENGIHNVAGVSDLHEQREGNPLVFIVDGGQIAYGDKSAWDVPLSAPSVTDNWNPELIFTHRDERCDGKVWHAWPFVYLHGEAEDLFHLAWEGGGNPPDISMVNRPLKHFLGVADDGPVKLDKGYCVSVPCVVESLVDRYPAVCVLAINESGFLEGRVSLVNDTKALAHACTPKDWR